MIQAKLVRDLREAVREGSLRVSLYYTAFDPSCNSFERPCQWQPYVKMERKGGSYCNVTMFERSGAEWNLGRLGFARADVEITSATGNLVVLYCTQEQEADDD